MQKESYRIAVIGCGYVGLPLALAFSRLFPVVGFDLDKKRVFELSQSFDRNGEYSAEEFQHRQLSFSSDAADLRNCNVFIIAVPTPVDQNHSPDLSCLINASRMVGSLLTKGDCVIYESTVAPGCTGKICLPILKGESALVPGEDFYLGFSPERVNPGDAEHTLQSISKVVSGINEESLLFIEKLYSFVVNKTCMASSIEIAEASKLVENIQRDVNIALMNELSVYLEKMGIPMDEVLKVSASKWNFSNYHPGLVGGHCIAVDPYYLLESAEKEGVPLSLIQQARDVNENMPEEFACRILSKLEKPYRGKKVLIRGLAFKPGVKDIRNTKTPQLRELLVRQGIEVDVYDPFVDHSVSLSMFGFETIDEITDLYDLIVSPYNLSIIELRKSHDRNS
ncbi:nucleotide sugar dehydrogenase [uncultured Parasutterella sp.]|uniref:nucleotide sugar dehydrogenase n=1 Tax=uncultured Parasutterella sp. TaxID=1263098 RepID=UPI0025930259|nr:nucleotide sugar dehydrogenase [uncultured Parasutterella sp.]